MLIGHTSHVIVHADLRLAFLAVAKFGALGTVLGLVVSFFMRLDGLPWDEVIFTAPLLAGLVALGLGVPVAVSWWLRPGRVSYAIADGVLVARRGDRTLETTPIGRIAALDFDERPDRFDLAFTGWFGYASPIPALQVELTAGRKDPSSVTVVTLPKILLCGRRQEEALQDLRAALEAERGRRK